MRTLHGMANIALSIKGITRHRQITHGELKQNNVENVPWLNTKMPLAVTSESFL